MQTSGNTILITGGGSGIGRGLAEAFHRLGNQVIVAGRRQAALDEVTAANPGMAALTLDIEDKASIKACAEKITSDFPALNVVLNNAGIMRAESFAAAPDYLDDAEATIVTNLLGPIRLTAALLPHFRKQPHSAVMMVSSGLAFVPKAGTPTYCATKAAIHSYALSLRHQLRETTTQVIEIVPPYVQTHLMGEQQASDPMAMPLADYLKETIEILSAQPDVAEVIVKRCEPLRYAAENGTIPALMQALSP